MLFRRFMLLGLVLLPSFSLTLQASDSFTLPLDGNQFRGAIGAEDFHRDALLILHGVITPKLEALGESAQLLEICKIHNAVSVDCIGLVDLKEFHALLGAAASGAISATEIVAYLEKEIPSYESFTSVSEQRKTMILESASFSHADAEINAALEKYRALLVARLDATQPVIVSCVAALRSCLPAIRAASEQESGGASAHPE